MIPLIITNFIIKNMIQTKMKHPVLATDFGIPHSFKEYAENYANFRVQEYIENQAKIEMTDRELLELAAKAAGYEADFTQPYEIEINRTWIEWDPLTDDGDALRLSVKLKLDIEWDFNEVSVNHTAAEFEGNDPYAATRRAIVRAAAEIGKTL